MTIRGVLGWIAAAILAGFLALTLIAVGTSVAHGQTPYWPDRDSITVAMRRADTTASPAAILAALAIAWEETAGNDSTPSIRGHHCWYRVEMKDGVSYVSRRGDKYWTDKRGRTWIIHHEQNCEVGRFQIKSSTARLRCPGRNVFTYGGNVACFVQMFAEDVNKHGILYAIRHQNGTGDRADAYVKRVLAIIGWMTVTGSGL